MTRLVFMNDPHYSRHAPECRAESYAHEILDKLHQCARIAARLKAEVIGCSGDWFHRKGKVTFSEANDILTLLHQWRAGSRNRDPLDVIGILGNHDIAGHSLDSLTGRAVGALVHSALLHLLDHSPWVSRNNKVVVTGSSYRHGGDANDEARLETYSVGKESEFDHEGRFWIHVAHGTLVKREFFGDYTRMGDLVKLLDQYGICPDAIVCGHLHYSEGIVKFARPSDGKPVKICRVGSLGRVSIDDLERTPQALVLVVQDGRCVAKAVPIGEEPNRRSAEPATSGNDEDAGAYEARIKDFVRILREEADDWSMADHQDLLHRLAEEMGHNEDVVAAAMRAVERRQ